MYEQAKDVLERIVSQYADSTIAVGLVSGQTKISNVALSEFRELEGPLKRYAEAEQAPLSCALVVARTVQREYRRIEATIDIARVFVKAGQAEQAGLALSQALDLANAIHAIEDEYTKARALVDIASEFVELEQAEQAGPLLSQALNIANTYPRLEDASWAECEHEGRFICGDFEPRNPTVKLFTKIAHGFVKAGQPERAESLLLQAFKLADGINWGFYRGRTVANIAHVLVRAGQVTQALDIAKTVRSDNAAGVLAAIARDLIKEGQVTQALDLTNALTNAYLKALALGAIMDELAETGQPEQAKSALAQLLDLANALTEREDVRPGVLAAVARELAKAGQVAQALDLVNGLKEGYPRSLILAAIARGQAEAGQFTQALAIDNTIKWERSKVSALVEWERSKVLALVAKARELTKAGQPERARSIFSQALAVAKTIKTIRDEYRKALALADIASGFVKAGHQPSESDIAILREIVQTAMPMEKAWERREEHSPAATNKE